MERNPLVTFAINAYNSDRFLREAIEAAFAQTYSPLEILLSDDCSTDRSFAIMQEMAASYQGPHTVRVNRNDRNLGICGHINHIVELSRGDLIVGAAGDDISLPERVETLVAAWRERGFPPTSLFSDYFEMPEDGSSRTLRRQRRVNLSDLRVRVKEPMSALGATIAFSRRVFEVFGPLPQDAIFEDSAIHFRSWALAPTIHLDQPLILYRRHDGALSSQISASADLASARAKRARVRWGMVLNYRQFLVDLDHPAIKDTTDPAVLEEARALVINQLRDLYTTWRFLQKGRAGRLRLILEYVLTGASPRRVGGWFLRFLVPELDFWRAKKR